MINKVYAREYLERCEATMERAAIFSCSSCEVRHLDLYFYPGKDTILFVANQLKAKRVCLVSETENGLYISW